MALSTNQLEAKIMALETKVKGLQSQINTLNTKLQGKANTSDLRGTEVIFKNLIKDNSSLIGDLEQKLAKVVLPENTRYYLEQGEVSQFQSNFNQLRAMMTSFRKLYDNLVAYTASNT